MGSVIFVILDFVSVLMLTSVASPACNGGGSFSLAHGRWCTVFRYLVAVVSVWATTVWRSSRLRVHTDHGIRVNLTVWRRITFTKPSGSSGS